MKKYLLIMVAIVILLSIAGCNDTSHTIKNSENAIEIVSESPKTIKKDKGTRSNPYQFGEDVPISAIHNTYDGTGNEIKVDYVFKFDDIWSPDAVENEYPNYILDNDRAVKGCFSVLCTETDNPIHFSDVSFKMITSNFEEIDIGAQSYIPKKLNNSINMVYNGGNYDSIFLIDGQYKDYDFSYITITYTNTSNAQEIIWIALPE